MGLNAHSILLRLIRNGGKWGGGGGEGYLRLITYSLHCHHQTDSAIKAGICVRHIDVSFIVWAKSRDSVHKPRFLTGF